RPARLLATAARVWAGPRSCLPRRSLSTKVPLRTSWVRASASPDSLRSRTKAACPPSLVKDFYRPIRHGTVPMAQSHLVKASLSSLEEICFHNANCTGCSRGLRLGRRRALVVSSTLRVRLFLERLASPAQG